MLQPPFDIAADLDTPVSAFRKLAAFGPVFLLESVEGGNRLARYSFVGLGSASVIELRDGVLKHNGETVALADSGPGLLAQLRELMNGAPRLLPAVEGLPFCGGYVGLIGYDFVRRIEKVPTILADRAAEPEILQVAPRSMLVFDHLTRRVALLHAGAEWERQSLRREIIAALRGPMPAPSVRSGHEPPNPSMTEAEFVAKVHTAQEHIAAGDVFQLVLAIRYSGECRTDPFEVYRALRLINPSPYMFFIDVLGVQLAGSSPEALVRYQSGVASLRPIAGTRARGATPEADVANEAELLADAKEGAEHVMLVDLARNDLGRVAEPGTVGVSPFRSIERYSHVMHIVSGVSGRLRPEADAFDLLAATFPAGTVVGAPKVKAMELIEKLEPVRRGFYAGTVGYFSKCGQMDQAIAIRTMCFANGRVSYQAGAGIVEASKPEAEYAEIRSKVGVLESALRIAEAGL